MIERGSPLGTRWQVESVPGRWEQGALANVVDSTGVRRDVLVLGPHAAAPMRDPGERIAAWAGRALDVARECHVVDQMALEVLGGSGYRAADARYGSMRSTASAGTILATLAGDLALIADDLSTLHANGLTHGGIQRWMLLSREGDGASVILAGFGLIALERMRGSASDDVRLLKALFIALAEEHADELARTAREAMGGTLSNAHELAEALRGIAAQNGGPYRDGVTRAPLFPSDAYREAPVQLPTGGARTDDPGLLSEMTPRDWRLFLRIATFAVSSIAGILLFIVRSNSGPGAMTPSPRMNEPRTALETMLDPHQCRGEPLDPVASMIVPGNGASTAMASACGEGAIRVFLQRGSSLWLLTRGSSPGMPWDEPHDYNEVTNTVLTLSRPAPASDHTTFAAWITTDHASIGLAHYGLPVSLALASIPRLDEAVSIVALGATEHFGYVAINTTHAGAHRMAIVRIADEDRGTVAHGDRFDLGPGVAISVWPDPFHPVLLASDTTGSSRVIRSVTIDLESFDTLDAHAAALPDTLRHMSPDAVIPAPFVVAAPAGVAADLGNGSYGPVRFTIAFAESGDDGAGACEGSLIDGHCLRFRETHMVTLSTGSAPSIGPALTTVGRPIGLASRVGGADLLVRGGPTALIRTEIDNDGHAHNTAPVVTPTSAPNTTLVDGIDCGTGAWFVFAGETTHGLAMAALPTSCTITTH